MKLTADTITDEQIRELRDEAGAHAYPGADRRWADQWRDADSALHLLHTIEGRGSRKANARASCAEIWNARHAKDGES